MKKSILFTLALGLFTSLSLAAPKKADDAKPTAAETKKTAADAKKPAAAKEEVKPVAKKTVPKSKQKPEELSEADKALLAGAKKQVDALTPTQKARLLDLANKGDVKALTTVDGVGEVKAKAIIAERPFANGEDLIMVDGIGEGTFGNILASVSGGAAKPEEKKAKTEEKKPEPKVEKKEAPKTEKKPAAVKKPA